MEHRRSAWLLAVLLLGTGTNAGAQAPVSGRQLYEAHCGSCHGSRAGGDGWLSRYLTRTPPALNNLSRHYGGKFPAEIVRMIIDGRRQVVMHGPRDMPVWGDVFRVDYSQHTVRPPEAVSPQPPHFPPPPGAEAYVQQNIQALVDYLEQIQR
jgi:mono/diheme cytochrome c family protein